MLTLLHLAPGFLQKVAEEESISALGGYVSLTTSQKNGLSTRSASGIPGRILHGSGWICEIHSHLRQPQSQEMRRRYKHI